MTALLYPQQLALAEPRLGVFPCSGMDVLGSGPVQPAPAPRKRGRRRQLPAEANPDKKVSAESRKRRARHEIWELEEKIELHFKHLASLQQENLRLKHKQVFLQQVVRVREDQVERLKQFGMANAAAALDVEAWKAYNLGGVPSPTTTSSGFDNIRPVTRAPFPEHQQSFDAAESWKQCVTLSGAAEPSSSGCSPAGSMATSPSCLQLQLADTCAKPSAFPDAFNSVLEHHHQAISTSVTTTLSGSTSCLSNHLSKAACHGTSSLASTDSACMSPAHCVVDSEPQSATAVMHQAEQEVYKMLGMNEQQLVAAFKKTSEQLSQLLFSAEDANSPAAANQLHTVIHSLISSGAVVKVCNPAAIRTASQPVSTGLDPASAEHWEAVATALLLSPQQVSDLLLLNELRTSWLHRLHKDHAGISELLQAAMAADSTANTHKVSSAEAELRKAEMASKLDRLISAERWVLVLVDELLTGRVLAPIQVARLMVHSYPYVPDACAILEAVARIAARQQQQLATAGPTGL